MRHSILTDLAGAAIYQPDNVIALIRAALDDPIQVDPSGEGSRFRSGQEYVLSAIIAAVWGETAVSDNSLTRSVATLRRLLDTHVASQNTGCDAEKASGRLDALELPQTGCGPQGEQRCRASHLEGGQLETASAGTLHGKRRSGLRNQSGLA